ncbi:MAG TPA: AbrB family transcriptional regulator [Casimicrobiaceae bacterium]|nr:AbrB family transcriptional regulator [Casimicrobiaceae bacterium]
MINSLDDRALLRWSGAIVVAIAAGALCGWLDTPIPWMLGPLVALALLRMLGADLHAPPLSQQAGQWVIGTALGLYFTPAVVRAVASAWYVPVAGALSAILIGYAAAAVLARVARIDRTTALFASVPGGAAEMAVLGERFGARVDRVAASQSLRLLMVVAIVPTAFALSGVHGSDSYVVGPKSFDLAGFAILMAATLAGGVIASRVNVPNPLVLGALAVCIPLTVAEINLSSMPTPVSNAAQLLLGCAIGSRFQRDFLRDAPRFVAGVIVSVLFSIAVAAALGYLLALASGQNTATMILSLAPGGIAEMAITAKVLQLGVPLVTACHVLRLIVLLLVTVPVFERARTLRRRDKP